jgi:hypothetical protein
MRKAIRKKVTYQAPLILPPCEVAIVVARPLACIIPGCPRHWSPRQVVALSRFCLRVVIANLFLLPHGAMEASGEASRAAKRGHMSGRQASAAELTDDGGGGAEGLMQGGLASEGEGGECGLRSPQPQTGGRHDLLR